MSGKTDIVKGRIKEAAGAITDDDKLRREGKTDQAVGKAKEAAKKLVDRATKATRDRCGKVGWALLWLLGVPLPVLLVLYVLTGGGCNN
jgi:uncharacterized protein YjbJ (UPF0337 family)